MWIPYLQTTEYEYDVVSRIFCVIYMIFRSYSSEYLSWYRCNFIEQSKGKQPRAMRLYTLHINLKILTEIMKNITTG